MVIKLLKHIIIYSTLILSAACREDFPNITDPNHYIGIPDTQHYWSELFDMFWEGMNQNYVFWDIDTVNWDKVYESYKPRFDSLTYADSTKGFNLIKEICTPLTDHHFIIILKNYGLLYDPGEEDLKKRSGYYPYNPDFIKEYNSNIQKNKAEYLNANGLILTSGPEGKAEFGFITYIYKDIACMYLSDFEITKYLSDGGPKIQEAIINSINVFHSNFCSDRSKALLLDFRHNRGGYSRDLDILFAPMIREGEKIHYGYQHYKNGPGRLDFTPMLPIAIEGTGDSTYNQKPVVVLLDLHSISNAEISALICKELYKDVCIIGERSTGALGGLMNPDILAGGSIDNAAILIHTPSFAFFCKDKKSYEGIGIEPDITVPYNAEAFRNGDDKAYKTAIEYLLKKIK